MFGFNFRTIIIYIVSRASKDTSNILLDKRGDTKSSSETKKGVNNEKGKYTRLLTSLLR